MTDSDDEGYGGGMASFLSIMGAERGKTSGTALPSSFQVVSKPEWFLAPTEQQLEVNATLRESLQVVSLVKGWEEADKVGSMIKGTIDRDHAINLCKSVLSNYDPVRRQIVIPGAGNCQVFMGFDF